MHTFGLTLLVLWIAVSNLGLGFALAVVAGHGPRRWPGFRRPSLPKLRLPRMSRFWLKLPRLKLPRLKLPRVKLPSLRRTAEPDDTSEPEAEALIPTPMPDEPKPVIKLDDTVEYVVAQNVTDDGLPLELVLANFQQDLSGVRDGLDDVDQRARACRETPTVERLEECTRDLKDVGHRMLDQQATAMQAINNSTSESGQQSEVAENLRQTADAQATQIRASLENIDNWEIDPENLNENCQRLIEETTAMVSSCQQLDACVADAQARVDDSEAVQHLEQVEASDAVDSFLADGAQRGRPTTMAMIDVDRVGELNDRLGRDATDRLLQQIEQLILSADCEDGSASQINAQRFLLLLPNASAEECCEKVEMLRAAIEQISANSDARITASGAVAMARGGDTAQTLVTRAEATLAEAKQFGRNRTFLNEGEFAKPYSISKIPSISTEISPGSEPMPTALLAPTPMSSPNT